MASTVTPAIPPASAVPTASPKKPFGVRVSLGLEEEGEGDDAIPAEFPFNPLGTNQDRVGKMDSRPVEEL
jgi:hypothetical protein